MHFPKSPISIVPTFRFGDYLVDMFFTFARRIMAAIQTARFAAPIAKIVALMLHTYTSLISFDGFRRLVFVFIQQFLVSGALVETHENSQSRKATV